MTYLYLVECRLANGTYKSWGGACAAPIDAPNPDAAMEKVKAMMPAWVAETWTNMEVATWQKVHGTTY